MMMVSATEQQEAPSMVMRWEKIQNGVPGKRWGHTCNAVGGKLYVFGGFDGEKRCQTNQVLVFDTVKMLWSEPQMKGTPPIPRDSHSCTTVGHNLFVFGGTDGRNPLNDVHILDTSSHTWVSPIASGNIPEAREGHNAALIGERVFIFGGSGRSGDSEIYYDDLYILNTETYLWKRELPFGNPPSKRNGHTCTSWQNQIVIIGGEDASNGYFSDVHILDADSLVWRQLNPNGQLLPPRGGHTTVSFGNKFIVFGGYSDEENLYDDVHVLDLENDTWTKVLTVGEGPSGRFSTAGESLDLQAQGVVVFVGGGDKNLEPLSDMYFLHTGIERTDRCTGRLSMRKKLKLKFKEQHTTSPPPSRVENDMTIHEAMPIASHIPPGRQNLILSENQTLTPLEKRTFKARVTPSENGYHIETVIDGRTLHGMLFRNNSSSSNNPQ